MSLVSVIPDSMFTLRQEMKALSKKYCLRLRWALLPSKLFVLWEYSPPMRNRWMVWEVERILAISSELVTTVSFLLDILLAINQAVVELSR